jgi:integrase
MIGKVTKRAVDALEPGALLWDREVRGFAVRRRASEAAVYLVKYRTAGRQRWYRIGVHGSPWTPESARAEALQVLAAVARGDDPSGARQRVREGATVNALLDRFLTDHVEAKLRASTAGEYRKTIAAVLRPALGPLPVATVTTDDVARLHQKMRKTPVHANRALALVAKVFHMAEQWGLRPSGSNPARSLQKYREIKRTRRLSLEELARLGAALTAAECGTLKVTSAKGKVTKVPISPFALAAVWFLLFTGARKGEILGARWDWLDRGRGVLRLPDSKTGPKDIVLPAPALAVLDELPRIEDCPYIIASGARIGRPIVNLAKPWAAILAVAKLEGVTLHTIRHSFASVGVDEGLSLPVVGKLLGHSQASTTMRYSHVSSPLRDASELVAGRIAAAMSGAARQ